MQIMNKTLPIVGGAVIAVVAATGCVEPTPVAPVDVECPGTAADLAMIMAMDMNYDYHVALDEGTLQLAGCKFDEIALCTNPTEIPDIEMYCGFFASLKVNDGTGMRYSIASLHPQADNEGSFWWYKTIGLDHEMTMEHVVRR